VKSKSGLVCAAATCVLVAITSSSTTRAQSRRAATKVASTKEASTKEAEKPRSDDALRIGVLGGVGFPRPLAVEGVVVIDRLVLLGAEYSALPTTTLDGVQTSLWAVAGDARVFPFRNGFFVGMRAGQQHLDQSATITITNVGTFSGSQTADTTFINPRMGFFWNWGVLALGIDAGVQIPLSSSAATNLPAGVSAPPAVTVVSQLSQQTLPTIDLLRIGLVL
jgi:hypothetical protein